MAKRKFKSDVQLEGAVSLPNKTASRALIIDGSGDLAESTATSAELAFISGVSSNVQTQLDAKIPDSEKGVANGVATLDGSGKIPTAQLPSSVMEYKGVWDADTNSPSLTDGTGDAGDVYQISVAGSQDLGSGSQSFVVGDLIIYNGTTWEKAPGADAVLSVNGQSGVVTLDSDDISEGATNLYYTEGRFDTSFSGKDTDDLSEGATNLYYTDTRFDSRLATKTTTDLSEGTNLYYTAERAQDDVGGALTDSASIDFTYDDGAGTITAAVLPAGVDHDSLSGFVANEHIDWTADAGVDIADANISQTSVTQHESAIDHDALTNFAANEHIDHSTVQVETAADSGLTGGGDLTATRSLSVDITGTTAETTNDDSDEILIWDTSAGARRKMTRANFLSGVGAGSAGDISETSTTFVDNQSTAADVTGLAFANGTVRSFDAQVVVERGSTYEVYNLKGVQLSASWAMSIDSTGDDTGLTFTITAAGQVQYTSTSTGSGGNLKFRATTLTV